jgi:hypothetical protein
MKYITLTICTAAIIFAACNNNEKTSAEATDKPSDSSAMKKSEAENTPPPDSATMMKNWQEYMTPGAVHKMMASWSGTWTEEVSVWMAPGAPVSKNTSTAINKMALGGRYQISNHSGSFDGMPFEGMGTLAYDNAKKAFESTWIDNMGTGIMHLQGPWDEASKTITLSGKMIDPGTWKPTTVKETFQVIDDNTQLMTMYATTPDGKEFKTMEIKFTRKK